MIELLGRPYKVDERRSSISLLGGHRALSRAASQQADPAADAAMYAIKRAGGAPCVSSQPRWTTTPEKQNFRDGARPAPPSPTNEAGTVPAQDRRAQRQVTAAEGAAALEPSQAGRGDARQFVRLARRTGLIGALGDWVIGPPAARRVRGATRACACAWPSTSQSTRCAGTTSSTASPRRSSATRSALAADLRDHRVDRDGRTRAPRRRPSAASAGWAMHLSIDDFGTGHSAQPTCAKLPAEG